MIDPQAALRTLSSVMRRGDRFGDVFAERMVHAVYEVSAGEVRTGRTRVERGVGVRRVGHEGTRYGHACGLSPAAVASAAEAARDGGRPGATTGGLRDREDGGDGGSGSRDPAGGMPWPPSDEMVALGLEAEEEARRASPSPDATTVTVRIVTSRQEIVVARSDHAVVRDVRTHAALHVEVVVRKDRRVRRGRRSAGREWLRDLQANGLHLDLARRAAEAAARRMDAVEAPSGPVPVVLAAGGPAALIHEACGHALEADLALQPSSGFGGRLGQRVAGPAITLVDDPGAPAEAPLYRADDEGEPAAPVVVVERGILRGYLRDRRWGDAEGVRSNGHGRRLGFAYPPLPRMGTTYLAPGQDDPEEIVRGTPRGIFVESIGGGDTDMGSGRFNLQVNEGFLIEGGRMTAPIRGAMLSGTGPEVLAGIDRVGTDGEFLSYALLCNKLDQFPLVVSVGQPTIRVSGLTVWGG